MKIPEKEMDEKDILKSILKGKYNKALELGIDSVKKLAMYTPVKLLEIGLYGDYDQASKVVREARRQASVELVLTRERRREIRELPKLSTGVKAIDELLGGGLHPGKIYGIFGEEGAGKSRIAHQISVTVQLPPINGKAIYMDSENTFSDNLIARTAERFKLDPEEALDNISVINSADYFNLEEFLREEWPDYLEKGYKLLIIDTMVGPYREAFPGRAYLAERQQRINSTLNWIRNRIRYFNTYCLITDQVQAVPDPTKRIDKTFVGGYVLGHAVTEWYALQRIDIDMRRLYAYDVIDKRTGASARFRITDYGLEDIE